MRSRESRVRYIAYFDIMGFKDRVYREPHKSIDEMLDYVLEELHWPFDLEPPKGQRRKRGSHFLSYHVVFSDTILFYSRDTKDLDLSALLHQSHSLLFNCLLAGIPIKGALAKGRFTADPIKSKYFGLPLIDAYQLAEEVHFYGAAMHHSIESDVDRIAKDPNFSWITVKKGPIPMKDGKITHYYLSRKSLRNTDVSSLDSEYITPLYHQVSGRIRKYVDNTEWLYSQEGPY